MLIFSRTFHPLSSIYTGLDLKDSNLSGRCHLLQLLQEDTEVFPGQPTDLISQQVVCLRALNQLDKPKTCPQGGLQEASIGSF